MQDFILLLQQLEQKQNRRIANKAVKVLAQKAEHFWDQICVQAQSHPDPKIRKRLIFIIATARVPTDRKKQALRELLEKDAENSENIRLILQYWF